MPSSKTEDEDSTAFLASAIGDAHLPLDAQVRQTDHFIGQMMYHGICGLLAERENLETANWPERVIAAAKAQAIGQAMWEMRHRLLLTEVYEAFAGVGIRALVLKGTALAYSLYERPAQRFRGDTDLLIASEDVDGARLILEKLGLVRQAHTHGLFGDLHFQEIWQRVCSDGTIHDIDLHWRVTNSEFLERVLNVEEFFLRSIPLPQLHPAARMPDLVLTLLHACINRTSHQTNGYFWHDGYRHDGNRLIWAYDIHLIASRLSAKNWAEWVQIAESRGVASICYDALDFTVALLGTRVPEGVLASLKAAPSQTSEVDYLANRNELIRIFRDFKARKGVSAKAKLLLARAFPSRAFMHAKYPGDRHRPLVLLYFRRQAAALRKALGV